MRSPFDSDVTPPPVVGEAVPTALHLRRGGTSVVIGSVGGEVPSVVFWGRDLGELTADDLEALVVGAQPQRVSGGLDRTAVLTILTTPATGWLNTPAVEGHRDGRQFSAAFDVIRSDATDWAFTAELLATDAGLSARVEVFLGPAGVVHQRIIMRNVGQDTYTVQNLAAAFPLPWNATEILDTTGHHLREHHPQRTALNFGTRTRESRRGRPGADSSLLFAAGTPGFGFEHGQVFGIHIAWSGNHRLIAERTTSGEAFVMGGELYLPGEVRLKPGDAIETPWVLGSWGDGLNQLAHRFHEEWRARPQHPRRPRPVTLDTWEAVYFDHSLDKLLALADAASDVGVERFVLDDGWFQGRRDDTAGLGDWFVDDSVWPDGLHPLVDRVTSLGMEFGLWVEPEMVNPESDLARAHPDWLLRARGQFPVSARQQQVLNLAHPDAYAYISERLHTLIDEYAIAYLKWDHNRDLVEAGAGPDGEAQVHDNVAALYRLIDELKSAHPGLEIESCASGGARVDLGILDRTDRVWTSDSLDPLERVQNQRYTSLVVPPEMLGMHLTSPDVHSSGRITSLTLSGAVALFGHFGIEWDLTSVSDELRSRVADWVTLAKRVRQIVATGQIVFADTVDSGLDVRGVVAADKSSAVFTIVQTATLSAAPSGRITFPGLNPDWRYQVHNITPGGLIQHPGQSPLAWMHNPVTLTGRQLAQAGLRPPVQNPQQAVVIEFTSHPR